MTMIRVIPRIVNTESRLFHMDFHVQDSARLHPTLGIGTKPRDRNKTVESKQSSVEIALVTCRGFEETNQNQEERQDVCVETEVTAPSSNRPSLTQQEDVAAIISEDSKKTVELPQIEDDREEPVKEMASEKSWEQTKRSCESVDRKQNCGDRVIETEEREKCGNWWKDSGQTILQFFAKILGKRTGMAAKGPTDRVLPTGKRVKRASRDGRSHNRHRRGIDGGIRLRRVSNGYIATHAYLQQCHVAPFASTSFFAGSTRYSSEFCSILDTRSSTNVTSSLTLVSSIDAPKRNDVEN
ncbi:hypothetical protein X777_12060 [Ooceraea biroi]|uniref:Uncharacterized protein n=1 Tax=Ooceraea biroi TaxID=2015173 RepID=A0A026WZT1_OOCBI|nr:hypothetical protein X777_12060 [Ooceraea biroi]